LLFSGGAGDASGRKRAEPQRALGAPIPRSQPGDKGDNGAHRGRGTDGSNPSPFSGESPAKLRVFGGQGRATEDGERSLCGNRIPDNTKTGVTDANYRDPVLNRSYHALGRHYGRMKGQAQPGRMLALHPWPLLAADDDQFRGRRSTSGILLGSSAAISTADYRFD
jgi:hypothetical protein